MMIDRGYSLIRKPTEYNPSRLFDDIDAPTGEQEDYVNRFASEFSFLKSRRYLGVSRMIIEGWEPGQNLKDAESSVWELNARYELRRLAPDFNGYTFDDPWLLPNTDTAKAVFAKLRQPDNYEITFLCREPTLLGDLPTSYGYDVGYWSGSNPFSVIADCMAITKWHTPPPEKLVEVAQKLKSLNSNLLFESPEEAEVFRDFYLTQPWAETESYRGEFAIIQLAKVNL